MPSEVAKLVCEDDSTFKAVHVKRFTLKPNLFRKRIERTEGGPRSGDWVWVYASEPSGNTSASDSSAIDENETSKSQHRTGPKNQEPFACGLFNAESEIAVRCYRWFGKLPDRQFWLDQIERAVGLREDVLRLADHTDAYRLIHGESDGFPGLVVDRYGDVLSAEVFSFPMLRRCAELMPMIADRCRVPHWLAQPSPSFEEQEGYPGDPIDSGNLPPFVNVHEDGVRYQIRFEASHKTGFFCDQRDNRRRLRELSAGKTVLDLCCYTGGFSIAAAAGGATQVVGVDLDENPLELAKQNANLNQVRCKFSQSDAFAYMRDLQRNETQFDIVVLDPPKLIRSRAEFEEGRNKHFDLNRLAISLVKPGGLLLTCSCAGLLPELEFEKLVLQASRATGFDSSGVPLPPRKCQILWQPSAPADHPVSLHVPETSYLKTIWMRVW